MAGLIGVRGEGKGDQGQITKTPRYPDHHRPGETPVPLGADLSKDTRSARGWGRLSQGHGEGYVGEVGASGMDVHPARLTSHALGLPTVVWPPAPCSRPRVSLLSSCMPFGSSLRPLPVSPVFNPLIIFATQQPPSPPQGGSCSEGAYTHVRMRCTPHARAPLNVGGLPGARGHARLHGPLHTPGRGTGVWAAMPQLQTASPQGAVSPGGTGGGNKCSGSQKLLHPH